MIIISAKDLRLTLVQEGKFLGITCSFYEDEDGNIYMSRRQIGEALGYKDPMDAIKKIHKRNAERMDKLSIEVMGAQFAPTTNKCSKGGQFVTPTDKCSGVAQNELRLNKDEDGTMFMYNEQGIYEICFVSKQKVANEFKDWVHNVLQSLKKNGAYVATEKDEEWLGTRVKSKEARKDLTDAIKEFEKYATEQGSNHANMYYKHFTDMANKKAGIKTGERNIASQSKLLEVLGIEQVIKMMLYRLMEQGVYYKDAYKEIKKLISLI